MLLRLSLIPRLGCPLANQGIQPARRCFAGASWRKGPLTIAHNRLRRAIGLYAINVDRIRSDHEIEVDSTEIASDGGERLIGQTFACFQVELCTHAPRRHGWRNFRQSAYCRRRDPTES